MPAATASCPTACAASRVGYKNRKRIAPFYVKNEQGVWDVAQRLHWDSQWAKAIGNPMAYDYGVMRQAWFYHHVSDWAGDDAVHRSAWTTRSASSTTWATRSSCPAR